MTASALPSHLDHCEGRPFSDWSACTAGSTFRSMHLGYQSLTEKEKQTLRLLLIGYDAKSMARHLGLSVHTVNERLRDARRKLGTSSSREAARQLRELEGADPELLGDKGLGDAPAAAGVGQVQPSTTANGGTRRIAWLTGGLIMSFALALYALTALSGGADSAPATDRAAPAVTSSEKAAVASANRWLALVDASDWQSSYDATANSFRSVNTVERWADASKQVRVPLGAVRSRVLVTADFAPAPPEGYWVIKFRTDFTGKTGAIERIALVHEDDAWRVVGYTID